MKKEQKKRRESVEQVCNHIQFGEKFQKLKWQVLQLKRGARIYNFFSCSFGLHRLDLSTSPPFLPHPDPPRNRQLPSFHSPVHS